MASLDINSPYLSSDAVTLFMQAADFQHGDGNGHLSLNELVLFMNQTIVNYTPGNPQIAPTHIQQYLPHGLTNYDNLSHFQVYYIIGLYGKYLRLLPQNSLDHNTFITRFNSDYGGNATAAPPPPPAAAAAAAPPAPPAAAAADPCYRPPDAGPRPAYPGQPTTLSDCNNCDGVEPISQEDLQDYDVNELAMLPSGNCIKADQLQDLINSQGTRARDPLNPSLPL